MDKRRDATVQAAGGRCRVRRAAEPIVEPCVLLMFDVVSLREPMASGYDGGRTDVMYGGAGAYMGVPKKHGRRWMRRQNKSWASISRRFKAVGRMPGSNPRRSMSA